MHHVPKPVGTRICLIRHGETRWNAEGRIQGHTDIPLNETGRAQALAMAFNAAHHRFHAIYSSDLLRATETAQVLAQREALEVKLLPQLRERHFGLFQGLTAAQGAERHPEAYAHYIARDLDYDFGTGESLRGFAERVVDGIDWLVRHHGGQTIAAVCHSGVLDVVYRRASGRPLDTPRDFKIPNCALNWFHFDGQGWHLDAWGDRHHLQDVLAEPPE
ncbi:MAG: phosphoglycerate kinase [Thiobacillus sp. GWE1_62_9]|nr:MAG: phosphoglycerate kinase [Thiobacillus sp. GWE1_62_9]HBU29532.1 histidine phosphatase family protein [Thiobacillus sp.]